MKTENRVLMQSALKSLSGNWSDAILNYFIYMVLTGVGAPIAIIINGPLQLGISKYSLNIARNKRAELSQILDGFKHFEAALIAFLLIAIKTILWTFVFIIPGIIAAISYSQTFFILSEKKMGAEAAIAESKRIMEGNKWKFVCLGFRFIGWFILSALTFGIGFLFLVPYVHVSFANFYNDIKDAK